MGQSKKEKEDRERREKGYAYGERAQSSDRGSRAQSLTIIDIPHLIFFLRPNAGRKVAISIAIEREEMGIKKGKASESALCMPQQTGG